ncbi:MAG TPA: hypothetical protein VMP01_01615 [Pirellulaceae bacterium]|nr:hypothetical protein [Pirellulaceae bacterium]
MTCQSPCSERAENWSQFDSGAAGSLLSSSAAAQGCHQITLIQFSGAEYHNLRIDVQTAQLTDTAGRPQYLVDKRDVLRELVG